jgi:endonuclease G
MAQSDWDSGYSRYEEYFRRLRTIKGRSAAFSLYGDIRQLSEIWLADSGEVPEAAEIVEMLRERMARTALPGVSSQDTSQMLTAIGTMGVDPEEELQAIVASGEIIPVEEMCRVIENRHVVAKVTDPYGSPKGTGFLLDARPLGITDTHAVFVTNNHVVATAPTSEVQQLPPHVARIDFQSWENDSVATFTIKEVKAESPHCEHDITVCTLEDLPADANVAKVKSPEEHFLRPRVSPGPLGRVHPIGHPEGGPLSLSLAGNEVIDHDLFRGPRGVRRLHYKANTKEGSSGSPVFGESGQVVAVHRAMAKQPIAGTSVQHIPTYAANEGIGIGCIISWFQGR